MFKFIKLILQLFFNIYKKIKLPYLTFVIIAKVSGFSMGLISIISIIYFLPALAPLKGIFLFLCSLIPSFFSFMWGLFKEFINFLLRVLFGYGGPEDPNVINSSNSPDDDFPGPGPGNDPNNFPNLHPNNTNSSVNNNVGDNIDSSANNVSSAVPEEQPQIVENSVIAIIERTDFSGHLAPNRDDGATEENVLLNSNDNGFPPGGASQIPNFSQNSVEAVRLEPEPIQITNESKEPPTIIHSDVVELSKKKMTVNERVKARLDREIEKEHQQSSTANISLEDIKANLKRFEAEKEICRKKLMRLVDLGSENERIINSAEREIERIKRQESA